MKVALIEHFWFMLQDGIAPPSLKPMWRKNPDGRFSCAVPGLSFLYLFTVFSNWKFIQHFNIQDVQATNRGPHHFQCGITTTSNMPIWKMIVTVSLNVICVTRSFLTVVYLQGIKTTNMKPIFASSVPSVLNGLQATNF